MEIINIHEAKTHLLRLLEDVARGKPFIIAKAGRPIAMVTAVDEPGVAAQRRINLLQGEIDRQFGFSEDDPAA